MIFIKNSYLVLLLFSILGCNTIKKNVSTAIETPKENTIETKEIEEVILKLGSKEIVPSVFQEELKLITQIDSLSSEQVLDQYLTEKLLLEEAISLGYEKDTLILQEIATYQKVLLSDYLFDKNLINKVLEESFNRYQFEFNASHIFLPISPFAHPDDTLKIYNELLEIRNYIVKHDNFSQMAKDWSKDPKTNQKGGNLGWFSAFHLIYPLEVAVFNLPVDSISLPVRSKLGYHIIKVNDKRPNSGFVKVQHIFKYLKPDFTSEAYEKNFMFLDSIKKSIENGSLSFDEAVIKYSDDFNSKEIRGELPVFGYGTREETQFEEAAFNLLPNAISKPFRSSSGLHLIKQIQRFPPLNKEEFEKRFKEKVVTDSRGEYLLDSKIKDLKLSLNLNQNASILDHCSNMMDERLKTRSWKKASNDLDDFELFTINNNKYLVRDFFAFVLDKQEYEKWLPEESHLEIFKRLYNKYLNQNLFKEQENYLLSSNWELKQYFDVQKNNLMISKVEDRFIIQASLQDTLSQKKFFEVNKSQFVKKSKALLTTYSFANNEVYNKFDLERKKSKPYQLNRGIGPVYYKKNEYELDNDVKRRLLGLLTILAKNQGYIVEIGGHIDGNELNEISEYRIKKIVEFLVQNGLPLTRVLEVDFKASKPIDRFDWSKNQRVSFQFYSNYEYDLIATFNAKYKNAVDYSEKVVSQEELKELFNIPWKSGVYHVEKNDRISDIVLNIYKEKSKFEDFQVEVIQKYQEQFKKEYISKLYKKYLRDSFDKNKLLEEIKEFKTKN